MRHEASEAREGLEDYFDPRYWFDFEDEEEVIDHSCRRMYWEGVSEEAAYARYLIIWEALWKRCGKTRVWECVWQRMEKGEFLEAVHVYERFREGLDVCLAGGRWQEGARAAEKLLIRFEDVCYLSS